MIFIEKLINFLENGSVDIQESIPDLLSLHSPSQQISQILSTLTYEEFVKIQPSYSSCTSSDELNLFKNSPKRHTTDFVNSFYLTLDKISSVKGKYMYV